MRTAARVALGLGSARRTTCHARQLSGEVGTARGGRSRGDTSAAETAAARPRGRARAARIVQSCPGTDRLRRPRRPLDPAACEGRAPRERSGPGHRASRDLPCRRRGPPRSATRAAAPSARRSRRTPSNIHTHRRRHRRRSSVSRQHHTPGTRTRGGRTTRRRRDVPRPSRSGRPRPRTSHTSADDVRHRHRLRR